MEEVNESILPPPVKPKHPGREKLPDDRRRVVLAARVLPETMQYLNSMGYKNTGRAVDVLVKSVIHPGISKMLESGANFEIVNLSS